MCFMHWMNEWQRKMYMRSQSSSLIVRQTNCVHKKDTEKEFINEPIRQISPFFTLLHALARVHILFIAASVRRRHRNKIKQI